jgi:hypothetical protein
MKLDSPLFDRIRVKPGEDRRLRTECPACEWPGCSFRATHRAPKGRLREQEYWRFCLDHVRQYNHDYNYFAGMTDDAVAKFQKDAVTGHRPTWKMGIGKQGPGSAGMAFGGEGDPFNVAHEVSGGRRQRPDAERRAPEGRSVHNAARKALNVLGLESSAKGPDIKARFKLLVKRHHPDANGGDRGSEERLREIIQAYNYLKSTGAC